MQILFPYKIGHTFWLPRVYNFHETVKKMIDGHEYSRTYEQLKPETRHKKIVKIEVIITASSNKGIEKDYKFYCVDIPEITPIMYHGQIIPQIPMVYPLEDLKESFKTEAEALEFARNWIRYKNTVYHRASQPTEEPDEED